MENKIEFLIQEGFTESKREDYVFYGKLFWLSKDRFKHTLEYDFENDLMYIQTHYMSGTETDTYNKIMENHNNLNSGIKMQVLYFKKKGFNFYGEQNFKGEK